MRVRHLMKMRMRTVVDEDGDVEVMDLSTCRTSAPQAPTG